MAGAPDVRALERALQAAGLSRRQARALLFGGIKAMAGEQQAEAAELQLELETLREQLLSPTMRLSRIDA